MNADKNGNGASGFSVGVVPAPDQSIRGQAPAGTHAVVNKAYYVHILTSERYGVLYELHQTS